MKRIHIYPLLASVLSFLVLACTEENIPSVADRTVVVSATVEGPGTRVSMNQAEGSLGLSVGWEDDDRISLFIFQNKKGYALAPVPVKSISSDRKSCSFAFQLPADVSDESPYEIYGLCGVEGEMLEEDEIVLAKSPLMRLCWSERKAPMWFHSQGGSKSLQASFRHLGTYEVLHLQNASKSSCSVKHAGFETEWPWYKSDERTPLSDTYDPTKYRGEPGDDVESEHSEIVTPGQSATFLSWYIPTGDPVSEARLVAWFNGSRVVSENTLSSSVRIQRGHVYHMYATWDGKKLVFGEPEDDDVIPSYLSCPDSNHPHAIDLGIGVKFACCNVGASAPWEYGGYYAWGETEVKDYYYWDSYTHCDGSSDTCHDLGSDISGTQYDVAHVKWGNKWCIPNSDQIETLFVSCSSIWKSVNGIYGRMFTGTNGGSIFLPAAGYFWDDGVKYSEMYGLYWSSLSDGSYTALGVNFDNKRVEKCLGYNRANGRCVRPVIE